MIVSDTGQARVFLINILFGMLCVAVFDLFNVLTKKYGKTRLSVNIFDAFCFCVIFCLLLYAGVKFNLGALRYYQVFGLAGGMLFQYGLFSRLERKAFDKLIDISIKISKLLLKLVLKPVLWLLRIFFTLIESGENKIMVSAHKINKKVKKVKLKHEKKKKTVKKRRKMI